MQEVYGRRYSLVIGRPERIEKIPLIPPSSIAKPKTDGEFQESTYSRDINSVNVDPVFSKDRTVIPAEFREWLTTQMVASVVSNKEGDTDNNTKTTIKLWNLSKDEQDFIKKGYAIILRAGYNQDISAGEPPPGTDNPDYQADPETLDSKDLPLIFAGEILRVSTTKEAEDTITEIICVDGGYSFKGIKLSKTYAGTWTYYDIIRDLIVEGASKYGVRFGNIFTGRSPTPELSTDPDVIAERTIRGEGGVRLLTQNVIDYVAHGYFLDTLNDVCNKIGYKAYFCLGKVYVEPKFEVVQKPTLNYRNDDELYYIRREDDSDGKSEGSEDNLNAIEFAGPLDGRMSLVTQVRIREGDYQGDWSTISVEFKLDYEGNDWDVIIRARAV